MSSCSGMESVTMVSCNIKQHNEVKSGHTFRLELKDMLNSHADSEASVEKSSTLQAPHVVSEMNLVLGSKVDELKVGSKQQEQLHISPKLNFFKCFEGL